ncbi:MAG: class I SAM-dependent methyltransferase, partial [Oscillospiraceae bacterium]|nr:class I SAM-dependent methyltransferase [Oscillospiraceae bacterium]
MSNETEHGKLNGMAHETTNATFAELRKLLARPTLHERTGEKFWDDPYISKQMLKAHLDPETDAASRKPEFIERSVEWICSLVPGGARLLDIGCGPGLYTKRFAGRGLRVTGMDISENSINYAREHDPDSTYIVQNYLKMDIDGLGFAGAFDIITLIWCDYGALVPEERRVLLGHVGRALKPGGLFLFDVFTPMWNIGRSDNMTWE